MKEFGVRRLAFGVRRLALTSALAFGAESAPARSGVEDPNRRLSNRTAGSDPILEFSASMDVYAGSRRSRAPTAPNAERQTPNAERAT